MCLLLNSDSASALSSIVDCAERCGGSSPFSTTGAQAVMVKDRSRFWRSMFGTGDAVIVGLGARMAAFSIVAVFLRSSFEDVENVTRRRRGCAAVEQMIDRRYMRLPSRSSSIY